MCNPYFLNKGRKTSANIILSNKKDFVLKEFQVAREFNVHFQSITSSLVLCKWPFESLGQPDPIKGKCGFNHIY